LTKTTVQWRVESFFGNFAKLRNIHPPHISATIDGSLTLKLDNQETELHPLEFIDMTELPPNAREHYLSTKELLLLDSPNDRVVIADGKIYFRRPDAYVKFKVNV
jgi:hypothetical protein